MPHAFAQQAQADPAAPVLLQGHQVWSRAALHGQALSMAAGLRMAGVQPGECVALGGRRGFHQVAALLAVWYAGAAFVPMDRELPQRRRADMARDCGARWLLGDEDEPAVDAVQLLHMAALAGAPCMAQPWPVAADAAAYVLYTSGSTGRPKGVRVDHGALAQRLAGMQQVLPLGPADRFLHRTPLGFDVAIEEVCWPLSCGAVIVAASPGMDLDAPRLVGLMAAHAVTVADFVPSLLDQVLALPELAQCTALRRLLCGGEAMTQALMQRCLGRLPHVDLLNIYGPTEAVINALWWRADPACTGAPPIGWPLPDTEAWVLDDQGQTLPSGQVGELCLGGVLAAGYVGQPALTLERFVPHPFHPGRHLYRSGDLASVEPQGWIAFHGRRDHQIKLRGARIELGEIEAALCALPQVRQACVRLDDRGASPRLVAYLATTSQRSAAQWRALLAECLPPWMRPAAFVHLPALPLTATGKVDREALAALALAKVDAPVGYGGHARDAVDCGSGMAEVLRTRFSAVLGLPAGLLADDDDFFELGGDSLSATELLTALEAELGLDLTLTALYEHPSVAALARHLQAQPQAGAHFCLTRELAPHARPATESPNLVVLRRGSDEQVLVCVHPGDGGTSSLLPLVRFMKAQPTVLGVHAWDLRRRIWPSDSVQAIAADYVRQLQRTRPGGVLHLFGWSSGAVLAYEMAHQLSQCGRVVGRVGLADPFEDWELDRNAIGMPLPPPDAAFSQDDWCVVFWTMAMGECLPRGDHAFWGWPHQRQLVLMHQAARALGRVPASIDLDAFGYLCSVVRRHAQAYDRYSPTPSELDFTLFIPRERGAEHAHIGRWCDVTRGCCTRYETGGDHLTMLRAPHVEQIAGVLDGWFQGLPSREHESVLDPKGGV